MKIRDKLKWVGKTILYSVASLATLAGLLVAYETANSYFKHTNSMEWQLEKQGFTLEYIVPKDIVKSRKQRLAEYNASQERVRGVVGNFATNYDNALEQAIRDSDSELEDIFRTKFGYLYKKITQDTKITPGQFFKGSDADGNKRITPDEFDAYMAKLPGIIQETKR